MNAADKTKKERRRFRQGKTTHKEDEQILKDSISNKKEEEATAVPSKIHISSRDKRTVNEL